MAVIAMLIGAALYLPAASTASLAIYGAAMVAMLTCSAAYYRVTVPRWKNVLQRLDHAATFLKIAGTYTPFAAIKIRGVFAVRPIFPASGDIFPPRADLSPPSSSCAEMWRFLPGLARHIAVPFRREMTPPAMPAWSAL